MKTLRFGLGTLLGATCVAGVLLYANVVPNLYLAQEAGYRVSRLVPTERFGWPTPFIDGRRDISWPKVLINILICFSFVLVFGIIVEKLKNKSKTVGWYYAAIFFYFISVVLIIGLSRAQLFNDNQQVVVVAYVTSDEIEIREKLFTEFLNHEIKWWTDKEMRAVCTRKTDADKAVDILTSLLSKGETRIKLSSSIVPLL